MCKCGKCLNPFELPKGEDGDDGDQGIQGLTGKNGASYNGTSVSSLTVAIGPISLVYLPTITTDNIGLAYGVGSRIRISRVADPVGTFMEGVVTIVNNTTGAMDITIDTISGTGTYIDWNLSLAGEPAINASLTNHLLLVHDIVVTGGAITNTNAANDEVVSAVSSQYVADETTSYMLMATANVSVSDAQEVRLRSIRNGIGNTGNTVGGFDVNAGTARLTATIRHKVSLTVGMTLDMGFFKSTGDPASMDLMQFEVYKILS